MAVDKETQALLQTLQTIAELDANAQQRVMQYLNDRFSGKGGAVSVGKSAAPAAPKAAVASGTPAKRGRKPKAKVAGAEGATGEKKKGVRDGRAKTQSKKGKGSKRSYAVVSDIDFKPEGKESLKAIFDRLKPTKFPERHAIVVYFYNKVLGQNNVGADLINTAYKSLKMKIPTDLYQSLLNSSSLTKYYSTADAADIRILDAGINYVENGIIAAPKA